MKPSESAPASRSSERTAGVELKNVTRPSLFCPYLSTAAISRGAKPRPARGLEVDIGALSGRDLAQHLVEIGDGLTALGATFPDRSVSLLIANPVQSRVYFVRSASCMITGMLSAVPTTSNSTASAPFAIAEAMAAGEFCSAPAWSPRCAMISGRNCAGTNVGGGVLIGMTCAGAVGPVGATASGAAARPVPLPTDPLATTAETAAADTIARRRNRMNSPPELRTRPPADSASTPRGAWEGNQSRS